MSYCCQLEIWSGTVSFDLRDDIISNLLLSCVSQAKRLRANEERRSLYDVLNLSRDASSSQVKKGYHKAALVWHPDKHSDKGPEVRPSPVQPGKPGWIDVSSPRLTCFAMLNMNAGQEGRGAPVQSNRRGLCDTK